ncbi:MAG: PAS domain-containing protein [Sphaerochaetaceae bacterium]|nr:PAS domain-containing protein [uncultured Sphaerochaeta sp.]MDC7231009.1 PAS domain-containing protein [Sphaerochaetaceae bacterium]
MNVPISAIQGQYALTIFGVAVFLLGLLILLTVIVIMQKRKARTFQTQETSLQHTSALLHYVIEHSRYAIAIHDTELRYLYVSKKYCEEYHIPDGNAIIGKHHYEVIPNLPEKWRKVHQRCLKGEVISGEDDPYTHEDGSMDYTRWECRPWYRESGKIGGIIVYTELLTQQKKMASELKEAHDYLDALLMESNSPILVWDASFTITRTNHSFASLLGLPISDIVGKNVGFVLTSLGQEELKRLENRLETEHSLSNVEIHLKTIEGEVRTILWNAGPILDPIDGSLVATIAQGLDITERNAIEQQNKEQLVELRRWYAVMSQREERIMGLKREVNALLKEIGRPKRYSSVEEEGNA